MAMLSNDIRVGSASKPTYRWLNEKIVFSTSKGIFSVDILGNELAIDTFGATVRTNTDAPLVYAPYGKDGYLDRNNQLYLLKKPDGYGQNFLKDIAPGTPVFWYVGGTVFAKGYFQNVQRVGRHLYKLTCFSGIGLLDAKTHYGGMYQGTTVSTLLSSIIGSSFGYTVDANVGSVTVYGHLPYDTARNNLHRLLFAIGAVLLRDANGNYQVSFLSNAMTNVPASRISMGGSTQYTIPADAVEITEHSFFALASDEEKTLFDNTNGASVSNQLVLFDDPMHDLTVTGNLTLDESSVNHAIVSGVGKLTGKIYTHNSLIIRNGVGSNNVKKVTDNELISFANSYYVSERVYSFYTNTKEVNAKIMLENEKPGQLLALKDAFGDPTNAFLTKADVLITSVKGAQCRLISGFVPGSNGNNFNNRAIISSDRTWTVPSGVTRIRIVLIGGGQGGQGGYDGAHGLDSTTDPGLVLGGQSMEYDESYWYYPNGEQPAALGGNPGQPGAKAAFLVSDQNVTAGNVITITVGVGGAGGARNGVDGEVGTPTTAQASAFGTISSDDGVSTYEGYNDPISGITYAIDGVAGVKGGDGGLTYPYGEIAPDGESVVGGYRGENVETWSGGVGSNGVEWHDVAMPSGLFYWMSSMAGAGGGGAAHGLNGNNAANANYSDHWEQIHGYDIHVYDFYGGNGGNGANAHAPNQPRIYGQGGTGGNGGGAGGNAGGLSLWVHSDTQQSPDFNMHPGTGGVGGKGSPGSQGANGCAIIYY